MKTYRALAYKELLASKITSVLILIAVILSTMMTTAIGQSLGILSAMRDQQAIALNGNRYATFVQMDQAQVDKIRADPRISYAGVSVSVGTVELNRILTLGLNEYWGDSLSAYPSLSQVEEKMFSRCLAFPVMWGIRFLLPPPKLCAMEFRRAIFPIPASSP